MVLKCKLNYNYTTLNINVCRVCVYKCSFTPVCVDYNSVMNRCWRKYVSKQVHRRAQASNITFFSSEYFTSVSQVCWRRSACSCMMEDLAVLNLLECPSCMEPLDASAKVLPCQHTFCMACLQQHQASHPHQMCCPECRAAVPGSVQELPTNPLLLRLLQSLQDRGPLGSPRDRSVRYISSTVQEDLLSSYFQDLPRQGVRIRHVLLLH